MPMKLLTSTIRVTERQVIMFTVFYVRQIIQAQVEEEMVQQAVKLATKPALRTLNVQRLMTIQKMINLTKLAPPVALPERRKVTTGLAQPTLEEEELQRKGLITVQELEEQKRFRRAETRLERRLEEVEERLLSPASLLYIPHTVLCTLEQYLWENLQDTVKQVLQQLVEMCEKRQWHITKMVGQEAVQKLMLQQYILAFMQHPYNVNALALRLTQMTLPVLEGKSASIYCHGCIQAQEMKCKMALQVCQKRKLITKMVAGERSRQEWVPTKASVGTTPALTGEEKIGLWQNLFGSEQMFMVLRYAYQMPFWLRRMFAKQLGMPENHKYAGYFGIGCIPTRHRLWGWRKKRYTQEKWTYFNRDYYLKLIKKYGSRRKSGRPYRGRYTRRG